MRANNAWSRNSRPDIYGRLLLFAQVSEEKLCKASTKFRDDIFDICRSVQMYTEVFPSFTNLENNRLHLQSYCDALCFTNSDKYSQLGCIISSINGNDHCQALYWISYRARGVNGSVFG